MKRVWAGRQGAAAIVIVALTAIWRGWLLRGSYFHQDDYYLTSRAYAEHSLSWHFLFEPFSGHVLPAQQLAYWLVAHHAPFDWTPIADGILVVEIATVVVMWHLLSRLLEDRWVRVPLLAVFAWTPLTLAPTLWWTGAMCLWPPMLMMLLACLFFLRAQDGAGRGWVNLTACVAFYVLGLPWFERGLLTLVVVVGVALARSPETGVRRITHAVVRWWGLWVAMAAVTAGYLVLHRYVTSVEVQGASLGTRLQIARAFLFSSAVPGISSGPWESHMFGAAVVPERWVEVVAGLVCLLLTVLIVRRGGRARWAALVMLAAYVAGDLLMLLLGRSAFGEIIALDPRYTADIVGAAVVFAAVALEGTARRPVPESPPRPARLRWRPSPALTALALTVLYLVGAVVTTAHLAPFVQSREDRRFAENLRADLARDPQQVLLDRLAPADIVLPILGEEAKLSAVFAPLPEHPVFDAPSRKLSVVTDRGHLVPVRILPAGGSVPGPDGKCGHAVRTGTTTVPMTWQVPVAGRMVVRLEVFSARPGDYQVQLGDWSTMVHVIPGPQNLWLVVPGVPSQFADAAITGSGPGTLCVLGVLAGPPVEPR